jgi:hypothetical protein
VCDCREPSGLLSTRRWSPRTGLTLRSRQSQRRDGVRGSSPLAVPQACHSQRSSSVPRGQPRTTRKPPRPAPFLALAGESSARSGFASRGSLGRGLHRPCRARPADRSLVAEDRSAEGVRDRDGTRAGYTLGTQEAAGKGVQRARVVMNGMRNRRSANQCSRYQAELEKAGRSSSLPTGCPM